MDISLLTNTEKCWIFVVLNSTINESIDMNCLNLKKKAGKMRGGDEKVVKK